MLSEYEEKLILIIRDSENPAKVMEFITADIIRHLIESGRETPESIRTLLLE